MKPFLKPFLQSVTLGVCLWCSTVSSLAFVGSFAEELEYDQSRAFEPYAKLGYIRRSEDTEGDLAVGESKVISLQLFRGNSYVCLAGGGVGHSKISVHIYDPDGNLVESKCWQQTDKMGSTAGACIEPTRTGRYLAVIKVESSPEERSDWWLVYGYK